MCMIQRLIWFKGLYDLRLVMLKGLYDSKKKNHGLRVYKSKIQAKCVKLTILRLLIWDHVNQKYGILKRNRTQFRVPKNFGESYEVRKVCHITWTWWRGF